MFGLPRTAWALRALGLLLAVALGVVASAQSQGTSSLAVPGRANAHVSIAVQERFVVAAWAASLPTGSTDIYAAVSRDAGVTFGPPTRVNSTIGDARINGEQPPRVAVRVTAPASDPVVTVLWTSKGASGTTLLTGASPTMAASRSCAPRLSKAPMRPATAAGRRLRPIGGLPARHVARPSRAGVGRYGQAVGWLTQSCRARDGGNAFRGGGRGCDRRRRDGREVEALHRRA